jgi:hypothetical protein
MIKNNLSFKLSMMLKIFPTHENPYTKIRFPVLAAL